MVDQWHLPGPGSQTSPPDLYFKAESGEGFSNELPSSFWYRKTLFVELIESGMCSAGELFGGCATFQGMSRDKPARRRHRGFFYHRSEISRSLRGE